MIILSNEELQGKAGAGDTASINELFNRNRGMIYKICYHLTDERTELSDLTQEAYFALHRAVKGYDPSKGYKFITYLTIAIKRHLWRYKKAQGMAIASLDKPLNDDSSISLSDTIADPTVNIESDTTDQGLIGYIGNELKDLLKELPEAERLIFEYKYFKGYSRNKIAALLKILPEEVTQAETKTLRKIRRYKDILKLKQLYEYSQDIESAGLQGTSLTTFRYSFTSSTERAGIKLYEGRL